MSSSPVMALPQVSAEQAGYWTAFPMSSPTVMDSVCSSKVKGGAAADNASVKVRKPYTITKQRERWTEDEHQKFLEALKLHGRAWRRIEEHIGTKTAVQIRSHAQKFFCKLEREASLTGSSGTVGSGEIAIPPPRPKRKPTHPYPKKASGAFSSSPSFEDETKSPPAVHSAFTPLESNMHTSWPKGPPKETNASLRLFGQTVIPCGDMVGADAHQTEVSHSVLMESTGSPRSQLSGEVEQPSEVPLSCTSSDVWNTCASFSRLKESTGTVSSDRQPPACDKAPADLHISSLKESPMFALGSKFPDTQGGIQSWQPPSFSLTEHHVASIPAFWQGLVPSSFPHGYGTQDDVNAAAAFAAVSYVMASAWQAAIQGAMASASNETNASIVYSPVAILPEARKPQSPDGHADERSKDKLKDYSTDCNDTNGTSLHGEDSTAECCSTITDTSRASCYESNDEGRPAKKHHRQSGKDTSVASNSHDGKPSSLFLIHEGSQFEISTRSSDNSIGEATRPTTVQGKASGVELHVESALCSENLVSGRAMKQPLDLIVQACELQSFMEIDEAKEPTKGGGGGIGHVSNKESMLLSAALTMPGSSSADSSKGSVQMGKRHGLDDGDRLAMMKAGSALSARYSGVGFVPYKRSNSFESSNKPED